MKKCLNCATALLPGQSSLIKQENTIMELPMEWNGVIEVDQRKEYNGIG